MKSKMLANITPGEILEEDFLKPMGFQQLDLEPSRVPSPSRHCRGITRVFVSVVSRDAA
jgi:hypothetical protein